MRRERKLIAKSQFARVESVKAAPSRPLLGEELRAQHAEYLSALGDFVGAELATRILDEYLKRIEQSTCDADERGDVDCDIQVTRLK